MADQLDSNTRSPNPDAEIDDPLAELARIIGYERPAERDVTVDDGSQSGELDLEAELMRELDVPQIPDIDPFDLVEADEAVGDASAGQEPVGFDDAAATESEDPWSQAVDDDAVDQQPADTLPAEALPLAEQDDLALDSGEADFIEENEFQDLWASSELEAEPESEAYAGPAAPEPAQSELGQVIQAEFTGGRTDSVAGMPDDDVLADMIRFDLPANPHSISQSPSDPAPEMMRTDDMVSETPEAFDDREADLPDNPEGFDDLPDAMPAADMSEPHVAQPVFPFGKPLSVDDPADAPQGFEDFLSTELDAFEQGMSMDHSGAPDVQGREGFQTVSQTGFDEDADQGEWDDVVTDGDQSAFDVAAEELLADLADGEALTAGAEAPVETAESWSVDNIEDAITEELDEELEDMFDLPDHSDGRAGTKIEDTDNLDFDLDFDLDQALAETAAEFDVAGAGPMETSASATELEESDTPADWYATEQPESVAVEHDEMAEAFQGLVPADDGQIGESDAEPEHPISADLPEEAKVEPQQDDWLSGFETSESEDQTAQPSGEGDYYFDAQLITEPDTAVEMVADIDVPEIAQDEPQPVDPDYDTDIEREFAGIIDASDSGSDVAAGTTYEATEDWSRGATASRSYEVSDDYIALERELGVGLPDHPYQSADVHSDEPADGNHVGDGFVDEPAEDEPGSRGPFLALAVLGFAVLAVGGVLGWTMLSGDDTNEDGGPRIIRADKEPVKVLPENPGGVTVPNQDKAVYDRVAGGTATSPGQPALVNSAEEPVDVVQRTLDPEVLPLEGRGDMAVKSEERLAASGPDADAGTDATATPVVSPRRVRTMIVKPDGSIVAREEPEPALETPTAAEQPVAAPAETVASQTATPVEPESAAEPVEQASAAAAAIDPAPATDTSSEADTASAEQSIAPVRVVKTQPVRAPVPQSRPADQPVTVVGTVTQGGSVATGQTTTPSAPAQPVEVASAPAAAAPAANPGGYYVQIASQPSEEGAQASWRTLSTRYNSVIGGLGVDIQRADIPGKGVFHRVRVPAGSRDQANALCARYKAAGGSCFVSR